MAFSAEQRRTLDQLTGPAPEPHRTWAESHSVKFYEDELELASSTAAFIVEGVRAGQPVVIIATRAHRTAFTLGMRKLGLNPDELVPGRDIVWLDAREALASFMDGNMPNPELFDLTIGNVFDKLMLDRRYVVIRAYGEMVDLLWRDGRAEAALQLERLWNRLASKYSFSLLCTYSRESLSASGTRGIEQICAEHQRVLPLAG